MNKMRTKQTARNRALSRSRRSSDKRLAVSHHEVANDDLSVGRKQRQLPHIQPQRLRESGEPLELFASIRETQHEFELAKQQGKKRYIGARLDTLLYGIIVILMLLCLFIVVAHAILWNRANAGRMNALADLQNMTVERDKYKDAYESSVGDLLALGRIYRALQVSTMQGANGTDGGLGTVYSMEENVTCLGAPILVQSSSENVTLTFVAQTTQEDQALDVQLRVDGMYVTSFNISTTTPAMYSANLQLTKGPHTLAITSLNSSQYASVRISYFRFADRLFVADTVVFDAGDGAAMFDCRDIRFGGTLDRAGALRLLLIKR